MARACKGKRERFAVQKICILWRNERPTKQTTSSVFSASIRLTILRMTCGLDKAIKISAYPGIPLENKLFTLLFNAIGLFNLD